MTHTKCVPVNGKNISIQLLGEGEHLIVLLHGAGVLSPILEFKALSNLLAKNYKVLVIENFGYGFSDCTTKERTIENIVDELHQVISSIGYKQYILMGHSISGIYSLYYSNQYPHEVLAFVGIDCSVPKQIDVLNTQKINLIAIQFTRFLMKHGLLKLTTYTHSSYLPPIEGVYWSDDEIQIFKRLYLENNSNDTVLNEVQNLTKNFKMSYHLKFPKTIPTLFFLSKKTCKQIKQWEKMHMEIATYHDKSKAILYEGTHFLHYSHAQQIANETVAWLTSL